MSRASFFRKIKSLTGVTPNNFILIYRLNKAAAMIRSRVPSQRNRRPDGIQFAVALLALFQTALRDGAERLYGSRRGGVNDPCEEQIEILRHIFKTAGPEE